MLSTLAMVIGHDMAQIMLGMVQMPQVIPNIKLTASQPPTQSVQQPVQQANFQVSHALPGQNGSQDQPITFQAPTSVRTQRENPSAMPTPSTSGPPVNLPTQSLPLHSQTLQQSEGHVDSHATSISLPQSSQVPTMSPLPLRSASQLPSLHPPVPNGSTQLQHPLHKSAIPLPPQPSPYSTPAFSLQRHSQVAPNTGFQHSGASQLHQSQPMFHVPCLHLAWGLLFHRDSHDLSHCTR